MAADHMKGINSLPRWDPDNPTKYNYDPLNYNKEDYAQFKEARQQFGQKQFKDALARQKQVAKDAEKAVKEKTSDELKKIGPSRDQIKEAAKAGKTLYANTPSDCFASLEWTDGVATMEFYRGGAVVYDEEMSLEDFLDWAQADSLGQYFNAEIRE